MGRIAAALEDLRALDTLAARSTSLARRDPRAKLIVTFAFVTTVVSFDRYCIAAILPLALYPAVLAAQAELPTRTITRAIALAAPFATVMALANPLWDRAPMLVLGSASISGGWVSFTSIVLRVALTASAVVVLVGSTGMHVLCAALARLGAPRVFTVQLLLLHRYLFVLADEAVRLRTAYGLRAPSRRAPPLAIFASLAGKLLLRAFDRAHRVHQAMLARGFDGELRRLSPWRWRHADTAFVACWGAYFAAVRAVDVPLLVGTAATGLGR